MTKRTLWSCLMVALTFVGSTACDEKKVEEAPAKVAEDTTPEADEIAPTEGKFSVDALKVTASQTTYQAADAPKPEEVKERLVNALYRSEVFEEGGPRELTGTLMYDVRKEGDVWDVTLFGGLNSPNVRFEAGTELKSSDESWQGKPLREIVEAATDSVAEKILTQASVSGADVEGLIAVLEDPEAKDEARLSAIQEIREREAKVAIPAVRAQLSPERRSELRTAAAATLIQLGDMESGPRIIAVAEDLSRERDPQYVPMLHILADLGGPEAVTYLEAVAEGHSAPAVREVAKEALSQARRSNQ